MRRASERGSWSATRRRSCPTSTTTHGSTSGRRAAVHGGLICVPLRGRGGAIGILTLERLGEHKSFTEDEFELVQLFGAQVSVAVQNARAHGAITLQAETDDLTGLRNHRSFRRQLAGAVAAGEPFSLLMVDLDRFKLVNDNFGHGAGNSFLQAIARAIVAASRDSDTAFRYGGDEFVVLLSGTDADHVGPVADRIRQAFANVAGPTPEIQPRAFTWTRRPAWRPTRSTERPRRRSSLLPTAPASWRSETVADEWQRQPRASPSPVTSRSRSRRRSTPVRNRTAIAGVTLAA